MPFTPPDVALGGFSIGEPTDPQAHWTTPELTQSLLDAYRSYGYNTIDSAKIYPAGAPGTCEKFLGQTDFASWAAIDTKLMIHVPLTAERVADDLKTSLEALKVDKVRTLYYHLPDRKTSIEEGVRVVDKAYRDGQIEAFGLSNFSPEEVEATVQMCKEKGLIMPTVYQGNYSALVRQPEERLIPILRKHGIAFSAYSPAALGLCSGTRKMQDNPAGGRFDTGNVVGKYLANIYIKEELLAAGAKINAAAEKEGLTGHGAALRWTMYHSQIDGAKGDAIAIGANSIEQLKMNLDSCKAGPLPERLVKVIDGVWPEIKHVAPDAWVPLTGEFKI